MTSPGSSSVVCNTESLAQKSKSAQLHFSLKKAPVRRGFCFPRRTFTLDLHPG